MSRMPKNKRIKKDINNVNKNYYTSLKLIESYKELCSSYNKYSKFVINTTINYIESYTCNKMAKEAVLKSKVSLYDNSVFEYYASVISCYKDIVYIYNQHLNSLTSDKIKITLSGLMSVVYSRIKEYDDLNTKLSNPINIEKQQILDMYISKLSKEVRELIKIKAIDIQRINNNFNYVDIDLFVCQDILEMIYKNYIKYCEQCTKTLDLIDYRPKLNAYEKLLKYEEEVFTNIIKIQASHLENIKEDILVVDQIFYRIRETYQHLCKNINTLEILKKQSNNNIYIQNVSLEQFKNEIKDLLSEKSSTISKSTSMYKKAFEVNKKIFLHLLNNSMNFYIQNNVNVEPKVKFKDYVTNIKNTNIEFANNIVSIFSNIINYTNNNLKEINLYKNETNIIEGIADTLSIKIESVNESIDFFLEDINTTYKNNNIQLPENLLLDLLDIWNMENINCNTKLKDLEIINNKLIENNIDIINKCYDNSCLDVKQKDFNYKKDYILFEVSTFEELLNYSILNLKMSNEITINLYVQVVEEASSQINSLLLRHNIITIKPLPHDMFNGKEHEVILVQKEEGFKKGEIIKVSSCGYKQNNQVILRASVIAAK